jgi:cytochrome c-type biogenesis protein
MRVDIRRAPGGLAGAFLAGLAFAIGWSPFIGPTLAAILGLAAERGHATQGAILLIAYGLGLGVPFLLFGLFFTRALGTLKLVRRHSASVMRVSGALLVVAGTLLALGELTSITRELTTVWGLGKV